MRISRWSSDIGTMSVGCAAINPDDMSRKAPSGSAHASFPGLNSRVCDRRLTWNMSRCASRKHGVDGEKQIRCDGSFEDKSIGPRFNRRELGILFVVDAESDQLQLREMAPDSANQPQPVSASEREINHGQSDVELARTLEQRNFIPDHHNRLELGLEKAAYAFRQAKMPICQKRTTSLFRRHLFISRSPPGASRPFERTLDPERVSMTSKIY